MQGVTASCRSVERTNPIPSETVKQYAKRLEEGLQVIRQDFYHDPDDEDGFGSGAVVDVINMVKRLTGMPNSHAQFD